ncbi:hypothetical protein [Labrys wisconsinensis]|uniref:Chromosome condensin MukBEF ATPase and DNA-binding subunit MukB n=1 Tax=Labrys wisconsinensis TaxID=425677 RepID=A0ABU0JMG6_9HYPH|nr:hypothetical protein [Labrys wisconsinensis]MDQ0475467.1 chromosome condensin MukBEF ATPase and DNA-binding subunit MukB [Labrys wisconsinensis]
MQEFERRLTTVEVKLKDTVEDLDEIKADVRAIRDAVVGARGGWKLLVAVGGLATALGAAVGSLLPWLHVKP